MDPTEVQTVTDWIMAKYNAAPASEKTNFLAYLVGTAMTANPPLNANQVVTSVVNGLPVAIFGTFYQIAQLEPLPAAPTTTTTAPAS